MCHICLRSTPVSPSVCQLVRSFVATLKMDGWRLTWAHDQRKLRRRMTVRYIHHLSIWIMLLFSGWSALCWLTIRQNNAAVNNPSSPHQLQHQHQHQHQHQAENWEGRNRWSLRLIKIFYSTAAAACLGNLGSCCTADNSNTYASSSKYSL